MTDNVKFEELKDLKYGDQIILDDPLMKKDVPYVLMSSLEDYYFVSEYGGSFVVKNQETLDGFKARLIDNTHPCWSEELSKHGKELGAMLNQFIDMDKELGQQ
jgi:hypothetical protein